MLFFFRELKTTNPTQRGNYDTFAEDFPIRINGDSGNFGETSHYSREWMNKITSEDFRKEYTDRCFRVRSISSFQKKRLSGNYTKRSQNIELIFAKLQDAYLHYHCTIYYYLWIISKC